MESPSSSKVCDDTLSEKQETSGFVLWNNVIFSFEGGVDQASFLFRLWEDTSGRNSSSVTEWRFYNTKYTESCFRSS